MFFRQGDIVIAHIKEMEGVPMIITHLSNKMRVCECEYWYDDVLFTEVFGFDEVTLLIEAED